MHLRTVTTADAQALLDIYAPYVRNTAISFEYEPPTVEEFAARIADVRTKFPYLAAVEHGNILGYAYAHPYGVRKAYDWSVELSIYLAPESRGKGIGRRLYEAMEVLLKAQNVTNLYVLVASVEVEDEYLTHDSLKFHTAMGYTLVGRLNKAGYKFGRWYDMTTMEKHIAPHSETQAPVVPWYELPEKVWTAAGVEQSN